MIFFVLPLLAGSAYAAMCSGSLDDNERNNFLNGHNTLRSQIAKGTYTAKGVTKPAAANMMAMIWDCSIEASAQQYANSCPDDHSNAPGLGENLYWSWSTQTIPISGSGTKATDSWAKEFQTYGWNSVTFDGQFGIGHATQMAWASSYRLGCGVAKCPSTKSNFPYQINVVCQYAAPGNMRGAPIYQTGATCSQCPGGGSCDTSTGLCKGGSPAAPATAPPTQEYYYYYY